MHLGQTLSFSITGEPVNCHRCDHMRKYSNYQKLIFCVSPESPLYCFRHIGHSVRSLLDHKEAQEFLDIDFAFLSPARVPTIHKGQRHS